MIIYMKRMRIELAAMKRYTNKKKGRIYTRNTHQIVGNNLLTVSEGIAAKLPKLDSLKRTIQSSCSPHNLSIYLNSRFQWNIEAQLKERYFSFTNSGPSTERILIFGTCQNVDILINSQHLLADGSFKTAPTLFQQVYVIHALRGGPTLY